MQYRTELLELINAIKGTLDMGALGRSLVFQRHFCSHSNFSYIRDNTGASLFVRVPFLPRKLGVPALSELILTEQQGVLLDRMMQEQSVSSWDGLIQVPLVALVDVWVVIASILQLRGVVERPSKIRAHVSLAIASLLEEAYQEVSKLEEEEEEGAQRAKERCANSFVFISPSHTAPGVDSHTGNLTPKEFYEFILRSRCFPHGTADLFMRQCRELRESVPSDALFHALPMSQPYSEEPCVVPAHRLCEHLRVVTALGLARESQRSLSLATFGAPLKELSWIFPGVSVLELPCAPKGVCPGDSRGHYQGTELARMYSFNVK